jgi:predicted nuclease of restriction endonuclease-like (RecB) superfamily
MIPPDSYTLLFADLKQRIEDARYRASLAVNKELVLLYWQLGRKILVKQSDEGWGSKVVAQLAKDLKREFPDMKGFSRTNLMYMRAFAEAWPDESIVQASLGQITWYHNIALLDKLKDRNQRLWYARETVINGWSRSVLVRQIGSELYQRQGDAITNFERLLPQPQSELAQQIVKDPYNFSFLIVGNDALERELEQNLIDHIRDFLLELGTGFAFLGSQVPITVDEKEYRMDLLFYHTHLHCYVVIDLKTREFEPEYAGKMNFYIAAVDSMIRREGDQPTIGIILCKSKRKTTAEYALYNVSTPIAISTHRLPEALQDSLPSPAQLEMELESAIKGLEAQKGSAIASADQPFQE